MIQNKQTLEQYVQHVSQSLPLQIYQNNLTYGHELPIHWHTELELIFVQDGEGEYFINGQHYTVTPGCLLLINPKELHQAKSYLNLPLHNFAYVFKCECLKSETLDDIWLQYLYPLLKNECSLQTLILPTDVGYDQITQTLYLLQDAFSSKPIGFELLIKSQLYQLFYLLITHHYFQHHSTLTKESATAKDVILYIQTHYARQLTLAEISQHCQMSQFHLCRKFKQETHQTINAYLNSYRLSQALNLLSTSEDSISEIALNVGYQNISYFNERFKQKYGLTPSAYRDLNLSSSSL